MSHRKSSENWIPPRWLDLEDGWGADPLQSECSIMSYGVELYECVETELMQ